MEVEEERVEKEEVEERGSALMEDVAATCKYDDY